MRAFTIKNDWLASMEHGWGNGYVAVPPSSTLYGVDYAALDINIHGGLTWSSTGSNFARLPDDVPQDWWVFGFDTAHSGDNQEQHDEHYVSYETQFLLEQLKQLDGVTK